MLSALGKRAARAGLASRIETRLATPGTLGIGDLHGSADFALLMAVAHEVPDQKLLFSELHAAMKPGGKMVLADPLSHCSRKTFEQFLALAREAGFANRAGPKVWRSRSAELIRE
jgi:SAM-dependent methyltransferase